MSVKPSARRNVSVTSNGAKQIAVVNDRRIEVVSGGPSAASGARGPRTPAAAPADSPARKSRRFGLILIKVSFSEVAPADKTVTLSQTPIAPTATAARVATYIRYEPNMMSRRGV